MIYTDYNFMKIDMAQCPNIYFMWQLDMIRNSYGTPNICHDDVIKWELSQHHWPFVGGIHRSPVHSPHKGLVTRTLMFLWCVSAWAVKQTIEWPVIWNYMTFMWCHRNAVTNVCHYMRHFNLNLHPQVFKKVTLVMKDGNDNMDCFIFINLPLILRFHFLHRLYSAIIRIMHVIKNIERHTTVSSNNGKCAILSIWRSY